MLLVLIFSLKCPSHVMNINSFSNENIYFFNSISLSGLNIFSGSGNGSIGNCVDVQTVRQVFKSPVPTF